MQLYSLLLVLRTNVKRPMLYINKIMFPTMWFVFGNNVGFFFWLLVNKAKQVYSLLNTKLLVLIHIFTRMPIQYHLNKLKKVQ